MVCYCFITSEEHIMRTLWILTYWTTHTERTLESCGIEAYVLWIGNNIKFHLTLANVQPIRARGKSNFWKTSSIQELNKRLTSAAFAETSKLQFSASVFAHASARLRNGKDTRNCRLPFTGSFGRLLVVEIVPGLLRIGWGMTMMARVVNGMAILSKSAWRCTKAFLVL